jgi:acetyl esterase/lipase
MSDPEIEALRAVLAARPRPPGVAERRERLDALGSSYTLDPGIRLEPAQINQIEAEWATAPGADPSRAILYIHGGGYISGSLLSHRGLATEAGRAAGARVLTLAYRRAPENPFPAAVADVVDAYRFMLDQGLSPGRIAVAGDRAGGGLTLALMIAARERALPVPACGWCISPWSIGVAAPHGAKTRRSSSRSPICWRWQQLSGRPTRARRSPRRSMPICAACRRYWSRSARRDPADVRSCWRGGGRGHPGHAEIGRR